MLGGLGGDNHPNVVGDDELELVVEDSVSAFRIASMRRTALLGWGAYPDGQRYHTWILSARDRGQA